MTTITVEHVSKQFKLNKDEIVQAVDDVSIKVGNGGSIAIMGPSGCGKTTLLRMIAGLEHPDEGQVLYNDEPIETMAIGDRGIGMVFQNYALMPQWDSESNIGFFLRLRKREREIPARVEEISKITGFGIEQLMERFPRELSGGEKQRVAIARAFARDLKILLFDEPFANLDAKLRETARLEARRLLTKYPATMVYVTHDQREAALMSDRIVLMKDGRIVQVGSYKSMYDAPANTFVAQFIGTPIMKLFDGIIRDGRWYGKDFGGLAIPFDDKEGMSILLGIRSEHVILEGELEVTVLNAMSYYAEGFRLLEVTTGQEIWEIQAPYDSTFSEGDKLCVSLDPAKRHYFDARSGERLT